MSKELEGMSCVMERLQRGQKVLVVWQEADAARLEQLAGAVRARTHCAPQLESAERLLSTTATPATGEYDAAVVVGAHVSASLLTRLLHALRPGAALLLLEPRAPLTALLADLTLYGFQHATLDGDHVRAEKTKFEVGARRRLGGGGAARGTMSAWRVQAEDESVAAAWSGAAPQAAELLDSESLLEAADRARPDAAALRVCATTGVRKACADCSCGLAEELRGEVRDAPPSSCGSCYLGDAFRCATCPHRGTPAFQPGDRVLLTDLASDL